MGIGRHRDVRDQQDDAGDGEPAVPDHGAIHAVEPVLDPRQRADQDQRDREQQHGFGAEQLPEVTAERDVRRAKHNPQSRKSPGQGGDHRRSERPLSRQRPPASTLIRLPGQRPARRTAHSHRRRFPRSAREAGHDNRLDKEVQTVDRQLFPYRLLNFSTSITVCL
jgi:hypothetical protein